MSSGIESFFPLASGLILLILTIGALLAAPVWLPVFLTGTLFFAGGLFFARPGTRYPWGACTGILAPFVLTSVFLVAMFGMKLLVFPALAAGGVASGVGLRRMDLRGPGRYLLGALWVALVVCAAVVALPGLFGRLNPH